MSATLSINESNIFLALGTVLGQFGLTSCDPNYAFDIIRGQVNRVPEPKGPDFLVMQPGPMRNRLATNIDLDSDIQLTGSITNNILTITSLTEYAQVYAPLPIYGPNIAQPCQIIKQLTGTAGGVGTYLVSTTPNVTSQTIYAGTHQATQYIDFVAQIDVHGPSSGDNAQRIATLFRDQFAVSAFEALPYDIQPLYADDPHQVPFINAEDQWEERWVVDVHMQVNPIVTVTQQFADELAVKTIIVETTYPVGNDAQEQAPAPVLTGFE